MAPATVRRAPSKAAAKRSVRQAHLTIARVEPWSVMKFSFVVSLVAFVILFVVVAVLWGSLSALGVFDSLQRVVSNVTSSQASNGVNAAKWFSASRILGWTALLGSLNIVLITAMSTIGAVPSNRRRQSRKHDRSRDREHSRSNVAQNRRRGMRIAFAL